MCSPNSAVFHILSPFLLHLIIFYQHFSICIFHTIYSYYILPGFCHLFCNPVYILRSCCTLQLINKLLPSLFLFKSNTSPCISSCIFIPYLFRSLAVLVLCHILQHLLFSSIALGTSSFHHHVSVCLGGHFVHPHTCSVAFCHTSFIAFHLLSTLSASVSDTSSFLSVTNRANSCFTLGSLSFHTFILGMCIFFFFLGAELMTTSPTSNRCCDTHSSPAMTLTFFL